MAALNDWGSVGLAHLVCVYVSDGIDLVTLVGGVAHWRHIRWVAWFLDGVGYVRLIVSYVLLDYFKY